ncbi:hypothetical protein OIU76_028549 [Salix suchowensis]|nr:hypothetical protein OIU76_028549 [Salix suchowensis]
MGSLRRKRKGLEILPSSGMSLPQLTVILSEITQGRGRSTGKEDKTEKEYDLGAYIGQGKLGSVVLCRSKVMEKSLRAKCCARERNLCIRKWKICSTSQEVVSVIKYCHDMGVVHRDIKTENILLATSGQMKLEDFGLAVEDINCFPYPYIGFPISSMDRTWTIVGVGGSPRVPSSGIPGEEDQVGPCEQLDALSSFNPLAKCGKRKENPWTDPIVSTPFPHSSLLQYRCHFLCQVSLYP